MTEEQKINIRIEELRETTDLNPTDFARKIGFKPNTYLITVAYNRRKPGIDLLQAVLRSYKVSARWLLLGEGNMWDSTINMKDSEESLINTARSLLKQIELRDINSG